MELKGFGMKELLLAAIKSESESRDVYLHLAEKVENGFLADRLRFIADEEEKHKDYVESIYKMQLQEEIPELPDESPVPLPEVKIDKPTVAASEVMMQAMEAELAASDFYSSLSLMFNDKEIRMTLDYLAKMEMGHYKLLEIEKEYLESQEDYDIEWEMMHVGP